MREEGVSAGLAFDGDADRVLVADETGALLDGDDLLAILAADLDAAGGVPAGTVVSTVMANLGCTSSWPNADSRSSARRWGPQRRGAHARARRRPGREPAGHVVLPREDLGAHAPALIGDGLFAGVRVLQAARRSGLQLSELRALRTRRPQRLVNVRMAARRDLETWAALQAAIAQERGRLGAGGASSCATAEPNRSCA